MDIKERILSAIREVGQPQLVFLGDKEIIEIQKHKDYSMFVSRGRQYYRGYYDFSVFYIPVVRVVKESFLKVV